MSTVKEQPAEPKPAEPKPAEPKPVEGETEDPKSLETRFGLVMYGGVSLAIYINGVAREFFRAVRGAGVYKLIKALTDRDVVVDVISGTSAGGINGIMLAYALCNGKDFASCTSLWRLDGDVRSLLRSPYRDTDSAESLFDSEGYYQPRLEAAFSGMPDYVEEDGEINSTFPELDLFVTGTDVDGNISTQLDDAGHPIDVKDHRSVFHLKHRRGRKHPFEPGFALDGPSPPEATYQALAKLSRITSCFPAAFTPVHVSSSEPPGNATADGKLRLWGRLEKDSCFLDGGVIDNKPFTYTIREIFNRSAERDVERKLFYVEPDPEHFNRPEISSRPNFVQAVIASLIGIPGYESIADDLRLLASHNSKVKQYGRLRRYLEINAVNLIRAEKKAAAERKDGVGAKGRALPTPSREDKALYERCSLIYISERVVEGLLKVNGKAELLGAKERELAAALIGAFDKVQETIRQITFLDTDVQDKVPTFLRNFDVYFRQRRLYRTVYKLVDVTRAATKRKAKEAVVNRYTNLWRVLNSELELLEIVRTHMEQLIDDAPVSWKAGMRKALEAGVADEWEGQREVEREAAIVWDVVAEALYRLLDQRPKGSGQPGELPPPADLLTPAFGEIQKRIVDFENDSRVKLSGFDSELLTDLNRYLKERRARIVGEIDSNEIRTAVEKLDDQGRVNQSRDFKGILQMTREFEREVIGRMLKPLPDDDADTVEELEDVHATYFQFQRLDAQMFPIEFVADLYEKDLIETIRISPLDAERGFSNKGLSDKVSGDALYHFAGFFKRSWRSNDILWGRLDSCCQLVEVLLTPAWIRRVLDNEALARRARASFFSNAAEVGKEEEPKWKPGMHPKALFKHAGEETQKSLANWLVDLLWHGKGLDCDDFDKVKLPRIIEAAQLEILYEDLPGVITDALEEQARWNQFRYPPSLLKAGERAPLGEKFDPTAFPPVYIPAGGSLDPFASVIAAAGAASDAMRRLEERPAAGATPMDTGVGQFFSREYRIGSEALLRDMPPLVLMEILAVSMLVMRNCLLKVFGSQAARVKSHPLYVFGIDLPLRAFNTLVIFLRRVPDSRKWLPISAAVLSVLLLLIGLYWRKPIIWTPPSPGDPGGFNLGWFLFFVGVPLLILSTGAVYLYRGKVGDRDRLRLLRDALLALLILTPCFVALAAYVSLYLEAVKKLEAFFGQALRPSFSALLAGGAVMVSILLIFAAPLTAFAVLARLAKWGRSEPDRLRQLLRKYFSIAEMLVIARRLKLFEDDEMEQLTSDVLGGRGESGAERKSAAYERVAAEQMKHDEGRRRRFRDKLGRDGGGTASKKGYSDGEVDDLIDLACKLKKEKTEQVYKAIEEAQHDERAVAAGMRLADRIVAAAEAKDSPPGLFARAAAYIGAEGFGRKTAAGQDVRGGGKEAEEPVRMIAQLEDMMYSINPGAMS